MNMTDRFTVAIAWQPTRELTIHATFTHHASEDPEQAGKRDREAIDLYVIGYGEKDRQPA